MTYFKETNADSLIKRPIFLVINSQRFSYYTNFPKFLYIFYTSCTAIVNITNIIPRRPDDGSAGPKRHSVDFVSQSYMDYLVILYIYIYIYIYIYVIQRQTVSFYQDSSVWSSPFTELLDRTNVIYIYIYIYMCVCVY